MTMTMRLRPIFSCFDIITPTTPMGFFFQFFTTFSSNIVPFLSRFSLHFYDCFMHHSCLNNACPIVNHALAWPFLFFYKKNPLRVTPACEDDAIHLSILSSLLRVTVLSFLKTLSAHVLRVRKISTFSCTYILRLILFYNYV